MSTNTPTTLASRLKEVYADGPSVLVPKQNELFGKRLKFRKDIELGKAAVFDVQMANEQGFTVGQGEVTLNGAITQDTAKASVDAYSVILQSNASYDLISRAKTNKQAFATFNNNKFIPAAESFRVRGELLCMGYGRQGVAVVDANNSGTLTITNKSWCAARMVGLKNAVLEAFTSGGTQHNADLTVTGISVANKTITVSGSSGSVVQNDILYFKGHRTSAPYGLMDIAKNTGTLYNISAATYDLWSANHYDVGTTALTVGKIGLASAYAADKGCNEDLTCLVPNKAFQAMVNDQAALREYGANYNSAKAENGFESIVFHGATGRIEIIPYMFSSEGEFVMFPERYTYLLGSEEMTNQVGQSGDIYFDLESTSAKQLRFFGDFTVFCERPGWIVYGDRSDSAALHT